MRPKITLITPVYNGEKYIEQSIKSIISQTYESFEYIIVDGNSKDKTHNIINKYKDKIDKIIIREDKTMYEALQKGFLNANGDYFCWINSDDYLIDKNSIKRFSIAIEKYGYDWMNFTASIAKYDQDPKIYFPLFYPRLILKKGLANNCFWGFVQQENTVFSKNLYNKVGGIDPKFKMAGDFDLWKRFAKYKSLKPIRLNFACHRKSDKQLTNLDTYYKEIKKRKCTFNFFYPLRFILSLLIYLFIPKVE
tara:strand:- start:897 stop:1646 length:750 start_codon:yes stop_codon:yes gene_type:complete